MGALIRQLLRRARPRRGGGRPPQGPQPPRGVPSRATRNPDGTWQIVHRGRTIKYTKDGFPMFRQYAIRQFRRPGGFGSSRADDARWANQKAFGRDTLPDNLRGRYQWHHVEDCATLLLVPVDVHTAPHRGGWAVCK